MVDVAIACCEQAIATAKALRANAPGMAVPLPLGTSIRQLLEDAETEYVRWLDFKESLDKPPRSHDRWNDKVKFRGRHELSKYVGERWQSAIDDLIEAIDNEHFDSQDYHHQIRSIRSFSWYVNGEPGSLRYLRLFGSELMYARVPKASMAALGYNFREDIIPSHLEFEEVFTLTLGAAKFWGNVEKRVLISCAEPSDAFFI